MASARPPQVQLLSNGSYHMMVSSSGGGYSHWRGLALTRWREDPTCLLAHWDSYEVNYRYCTTLYRIRVLQITVEDDGPHLSVDGAELSGSTILLTDDGGEHAVVVRIHKTGA